MISVDKTFMKINSIAEDYFHRCTILGVSWVATSSSNGLKSHHKHGADRCGTEDFGRHLRRTHKYKQQGKFTSYVSCMRSYISCACNNKHY